MKKYVDNPFESPAVMRNKTINKPCNECGIVFPARTDNIKNGQGKFCSRKCSAKDRQRKRMKYKKCPACGSVFHAYKRKMSCCSVKCSRIITKPNFKSDRTVVLANRKAAVFCCNLIRRCLKTKSEKTFAALGYDSKTLRSYIQSKWKPGMSWDNYGHSGQGVWNIDHIFPISKFPKTALICEINALSNLQPLWSLENYSKKDKI